MVMGVGKSYRWSGGVAGVQGPQGGRMPIFNLHISSFVQNVYAYIHILCTFYTRLSPRRVDLFSSSQECAWWLLLTKWFQLDIFSSLFKMSLWMPSLKWNKYISIPPERIKCASNQASRTYSSKIAQWMHAYLHPFKPGNLLSVNHPVLMVDNNASKFSE